MYIVVYGEIVDGDNSLETLFSHHDNKNDESYDNNEIPVVCILYTYNLPDKDYLKIPEGTMHIRDRPNAIIFTKIYVLLKN